MVSSWYWHLLNVGLFTASELHLHQQPLLGSLQELRAYPLVPSLNFSLKLPQSWAIYYNWCCTFTYDLSWHPFRDSTPTKQCQATAYLHDPTMSPKSNSTLRYYQVQPPARGVTLTASGPQLPRTDSEETLLRFCLSDVGLFFTTANFSVPASQHQLPQKRKGCTLLFFFSR